jgi:phosphatidylserine/phosphatidylglycerophosphate/cardiolipin synthase-like enzyme
MVIPQATRIDALQALIDSAEHDLRTLAYNVSAPQPGASFTYKRLWTSLLTKPASGTNCRIIAPTPITTRTTRTHTDLSIRALATAGWHTYYLGPPGKQHAKLWLADNHTAAFGSANLSDTALNTNHEILYITHDLNDLRALHELFTVMQRKSRHG